MTVKQKLEDAGYGQLQGKELLREDLNMDSLDMAFYGIEFKIPENEWANLKTVDDLESWVDNNLKS